MTGQGFHAVSKKEKSIRTGRRSDARAPPQAGFPRSGPAWPSPIGAGYGPEHYKQSTCPPARARAALRTCNRRAATGFLRPGAQSARCPCPLWLFQRCPAPRILRGAAGRMRRLRKRMPFANRFRSGSASLPPPQNLPLPLSRKAFFCEEIRDIKLARAAALRCFGAGSPCSPLQVGGPSGPYLSGALRPRTPGERHRRGLIPSRGIVEKGP